MMVDDRSSLVSLVEKSLAGFAQRCCYKKQAEKELG